MARKRQKRGKRSDAEIARRQANNRFLAEKRLKEAELRLLRAKIRRRKLINSFYEKDKQRGKAKGPAPSERTAVGRDTHSLEQARRPVGATERRTTKRQTAAAALVPKQRPAPKVHSKNSPRAHCKEKPTRTQASTGGGGRRSFIPWCGSDFGSHMRRKPKR